MVPANSDSVRYYDSQRGNSMMGQLNRNQGQLFYSFCLEEIVPADHLVRDIAAVLNLDWVRAELAPHYSPLGRPSILSFVPSSARRHFGAIGTFCDGRR